MVNRVSSPVLLRDRFYYQPGDMSRGCVKDLVGSPNKTHLEKFWNGFIIKKRLTLRNWMYTFKMTLMSTTQTLCNLTRGTYFGELLLCRRRGHSVVRTSSVSRRTRTENDGDGRRRVVVSKVWRRVSRTLEETYFQDRGVIPTFSTLLLDSCRLFINDCQFLEV